MEQISPLIGKVGRVLACALGGLHHLDGKIVDRGTWAEYAISFGSLSTYDSDILTRLVVCCHDECLRMELDNGGGPYKIKIIFHNRSRKDPRKSRSRYHPTMEEAVAYIRKTGVCEDPTPHHVVKR